MIKRMKSIILITIFCFISFFLLEQHTLAKDDGHDFDSKKTMSIEEIYEVKGIKEKINVFEKKFDSVVMLPEEMPFKVIKKFAKIEEDNTLSLHFIGGRSKRYLSNNG